MTRKQVIRALIKDYERAIEEWWDWKTLKNHHMNCGVCYAAGMNYNCFWFYDILVEYLGEKYFKFSPEPCNSINSLTARLFLLRSLND